MEPILYGTNRIVLFAEYGDPKPHSHFSKHILAADRPFSCLVGEQEYPVRSIMLQSRVLHSVKTEPGSKLLVFLIDETSDLAKHMDRQYLHGASHCCLPPSMEQGILERIRSGCGLGEIDRELLGFFPCDASAQPPLDRRIAYALNCIEECNSLDSDLYDTLARKLCLSKSRVSHLFKEQMGIDIKNYLLLKRLEKVYDAVTQTQMSITEAALMAGFSSSAHFAAACKKHYGISLTDFLKAQKI